MKKIVRIKESELVNLIDKIITETTRKQKISEGVRKLAGKQVIKEVGIIDKTKMAFGGQLKNPRQFNTKNIDGSKLTPEQIDVKNKIIMVLNELNKNAIKQNDDVYLTTIDEVNLVDKGLVIKTHSMLADRLINELKSKGLKVNSTQKTSDGFENQLNIPSSVTYYTITVTKTD